MNNKICHHLVNGVNYIKTKMYQKKKKKLLNFDF